ncbi:methionyl-tRNA formyltransferase [Desulfovibrio sp. JC022]|uniref:methionyl-tRNA formyltransferase n=1 Tax=Desulfovibrio sp. JC022 TaxID=2593642 RepID=UPI0013D5EACE|nr:methionyl-tRNA formyltransferase [Desulfovibrio sp. JC022]NDV24330.1 methionyl-tRNA formyltransferase [Desulfovibrio sp. JC022]
MAIIRQLEHRELERFAKHTETEGTYSIVELDGKKYLQIDTYGSKQRQDRGKISQSLRLSQEAIEQLLKIIKTNF